MYVLTKVTERREYEPTDNRPIGVYADMEAVETRLARIAAANPQYPLRKTGATSWEIGPDEDQGFFGHSKVWLHLYEVTS